MINKKIFLNRIKGDEVGVILAKLAKRNVLINIHYNKGWTVSLTNYGGLVIYTNNHIRATSLRAAVMVAIKKWAKDE